METMTTIAMMTMSKMEMGFASLSSMTQKSPEGTPSRDDFLTERVVGNETDYLDQVVRRFQQFVDIAPPFVRAHACQVQGVGAFDFLASRLPLTRSLSVRYSSLTGPAPFGSAELICRKQSERPLRFDAA